MRANILSSAFSGIVAGVALGTFRGSPDAFISGLVPVTIVTSLILGAIGLRQLVDLFAVQWRTFPSLSPSPEDMKLHVVPSLLRALTWFIALAVVAIYLTPNSPNKAPEPTTTSVTPPAAQVPRQP